MARLRLVALAAVVVLMSSSCTYLQLAQFGQGHGASVPWWCNSTEEIPVTQGPAMGSVDYYAGTHKTPLTWEQCKQVSAQFDVAKAYALQWPTENVAEAAGWRMATPYVPGMGTHHIRGGITPAILTDPSFKRENPDLSAAGLDDTFNPAKPEVLQFDGNGPSAKLVGFDYYVHTNTGRPPEGFVGNNDWWHIHPEICFRTSDAVMIGFNTTDAKCTSMQGINVNMSNFYMLHVWILDDMQYIPDVYAGMIPCISGGTAVHDPNDPCHTTPHDMGTMAAGDARLSSASTREAKGDVCTLDPVV